MKKTLHSIIEQNQDKINFNESKTFCNSSDLIRIIRINLSSFIGCKSRGMRFRILLKCFSQNNDDFRSRTDEMGTWALTWKCDSFSNPQSFETISRRAVMRIQNPIEMKGSLGPSVKKPVCPKEKCFPFGRNKVGEGLIKKIIGKREQNFLFFYLMMGKAKLSANMREHIFSKGRCQKNLENIGRNKYIFRLQSIWGSRSYGL